ncbi:hypothetical protein SAMN05421677_13816, partial [Halobacillus aidingensis]
KLVTFRALGHRPTRGAFPASTHGQVERRNLRAQTPRDMGGSTTMFNVEIQGAIIKPIYWNLTSPVCLSAYTYSIFIKKWDIFE